MSESRSGKIATDFVMQSTASPGKPLELISEEHRRKVPTLP